MSTKKVLTTFSLTMINVAAIASLRNLPVTAVHGFQLIFYLTLAALFFFVPTALIAAELVAHYPQEGGIYIWVRRAFGKKVGFLAIWLQWLGVLIWYPTSLVFIAATLGSLFSPVLAEDPWFIFAAVTAVFWGCTWINCRGMEISSWISTLGVVLGTIIPGLAIILLGSYWWISGAPLQIHVGLGALLPHSINLGQIPLLCGIAVSFIGMEMSEVHASDVAHPQKTFPRSILSSALIIFALYALGSLAIAFVIPSYSLSLTGGVIHAFHFFLSSYNLGALTPLFALLMIVGVTAGVSTWIVGPSRGIMIAAEEGHLPAFLSKRNEAKMPSHIMVIQACAVTLLTSAFIFMPSVHTAFILLTVIGAQVVMVMYGIMFAAALSLRKHRTPNPNLFSIPTRYGMHITSGIGFIGIAAIIGVGFFPPEGIDIFVYEIFLVAGLAVGCLFPSAYRFISRALCVYSKKT